MQYLPNKHREDYVTFKEESNCYLCGLEFATFSLNRGRTHCRKCGNSVCKDCCQSKLPLSKEKVTETEKVCDQCCAEIQNLHIKHFYKQIAL